MRERGTDAEKQYKGMLDDYQKANEDYKKLVESANDQAVSAEERDKRKKSAEAKVLELNEIEKTLTQFKREKQATFDEQKRRMRDQIVREIREQINNRARRRIQPGPGQFGGKHQPGPLYPLQYRPKRSHRRDPLPDEHHRSPRIPRRRK